jgi:hypothetical protein
MMCDYTDLQQQVQNWGNPTDAIFLRTSDAADGSDKVLVGISTCRAQPNHPCPRSPFATEGDLGCPAFEEMSAHAAFGQQGPGDFLGQSAL